MPEFLSVSLLILTLGCAVDLLRSSIAGKGWHRSIGVAWVAMAVLLLRPHGDTFTALDHSGYRLMAHAFVSGRGPNDVDRMILEIPEEAVQDCTLLPRTLERNTRDRSFLLRSGTSAETEPFFYPALPLSAAALQRFWPRGGMDLFIPLLGMLLAWGLVASGGQSSGAPGVLLASALFIGSPLPVMMLRGFYAEVCGAVLIALAVQAWLLSARRRSPTPLSAYVAIGLAPAFHPVLLVLSLPLWVGFVASGRESRLQSALRLCGFLLGSALLWWMTEHICSPYGRISLGNLRHNFRVSQAHQVSYLFIGGSGLLLGGLFLWRMLHPASLRKSLEFLQPGARAWMLLSAVPILLSLLAWSESVRVRSGLSELGIALGWPFGMLVIACCVVLLADSGRHRERIVFTVVLAVLPVFAYLKGAEQMGMWSQRRLVPVLLPLLPVLLLPMADVLRRWRIRARWMPLLAGMGAIALGGYNAVRWPAPYLVRQEKGALDRVQELKARIGDRLVFFDYLPDSFPFAVDGTTRALGWNPRGRERSWSVLMSWLAERAREEEVWMVSSYASSGMEEGLELQSLAVEVVPTVRVHSKTAVPVERRIGQRRLEFVAVVPLEDTPPVLDKRFDGGPLALRGPWGPVRRLPLADGSWMQGQWSREGSGIVGPIPRGRRRLFLRILASSGRDGKEQRIRLVPPWGDAGELVLTIAPEGEEQVFWLDAPACGEQPLTGLYRLHAEHPYDPSLEGLRGYPSDLGVLIGRVEMAEEPAD